MNGDYDADRHRQMVQPHQRLWLYPAGDRRQGHLRPYQRGAACWDADVEGRSESHLRDPDAKGRSPVGRELGRRRLSIPRPEIPAPASCWTRAFYFGGYHDNASPSPPAAPTMTTDQAGSFQTISSRKQADASRKSAGPRIA